MHRTSENCRRDAFVYTVRSLGLNPDQFEKVYQSIDELSVDGYMAFSKKTPDKMVIRFSEAFARVKSGGEHERILSKYSGK